ncbi:DUF4433 domain-containing protein [Bradyrhizobium jicamae]|uniref:type II toxin-antitoxin system toxin DNA ADP-ribosyl transferase DarT n=1 Tax=Bradyrhizobium jicamae TaxID=280332 RepID=UPI001BADC169|nr:DUF4433 domain-containing protein [Bradyrhizobium jicamae]MBR0756538.1 DUF4433 domain-containing protein [Bradyrhizobium jicamae]
MPRPTPTQIFHITAIDNLVSISKVGLLSKREVATRGVGFANIAFQTVQGYRSVKAVPIAPGGNLHDYVPFYFGPRSPMLRTIDAGNVDGCTYRQDDIVHLTTTVEAISAAGLASVFTNYHAVKAFAEFFSIPADLDRIDWELFFEAPRLGGYCKYWNSVHSKARYALRMETRQAEFLVHNSVPLAVLGQIAVRTEQMAERVRRALANTGWTPDIRIVPGWYY